MHPGSHLSRTRPRERPFRAILQQSRRLSFQVPLYLLLRNKVSTTWGCQPLLFIVISTPTRRTIKVAKMYIIRRKFRQLHQIRSKILNRDVDKVVHQWNLKFNGSSKASAEDFLTRVDECRIFSPLMDIELISSLLLLLTGVTLQCYRLKKSQWTSWSTFRTAFRSRFGDDNFDRSVRDQIRVRT